MSWTRIVLVVILSLLLLGIIGLGGLQWYKSYPSYYYGSAERAVEKEDYESAKLNLLRLIIKHPTHAEGHELLSRVILDEARANERPASYAANPAAISHLARAVELKPREIVWRRRLLSAFLQARQIAKAAEVAEQVYAEDKTNGDAHLALTWRAVTARDSAEVERLFAESNNVVSRYVFHEFALKLTYYSQVPGAESPDEYRKALLEAVHTAHRLSEDDLRLLMYRDREMMLRILMRAQLQLINASDKTNAAQILVGVCEKLQRSALLDKQLIAEAAATSQRMLVDNSSTKTLTEEHRVARRQLMKRTGEIASDAVATTEQDGGQSPLIAYWNNAISLFGDGKSDEALQTLARGIAVAEELGTGGKVQQLEMHLLSAQILMADRRYAEAVNHLELLKGIDRYEGWGHLLRGSIALNEGQMEAAMVEFQLAELKLDDSLQVHSGLVRACLELQRWREAILHLEALLVPDEELSPQDRAWRRSKPGLADHAHLDLLRSRLILGQWEQSQQHLRELRDTAFAPEAWRLAIVFLRLDGQKEKAWKYLRLVRQKYPEDINFVFLEVDMLEAEGKSARAEFVFKDFVASKPYDLVRQLAMARWLLMQGKPQRALEILKDIHDDINLTPKGRNTLYILTAQAQMQIREFEKAQAIVDALIANPDTKPAGHLLNAMIAQSNGQNQLADQMLAQMQLANTQQVGRDRSVVQIRRPNGDLASAVVQNTYYW